MYLDFFNNEALDLWSRGLDTLRNQIPFDGIQLDINEPYGSCNGECPSAKESEMDPARFLQEVCDVENHTWYTSYSSQDSESTYDLPFIPGPKANLDNLTVSLNATHPSNNFEQYNTHSLFGHMQAKATRDWLELITPLFDKRPFVVSRSTFAGSGKYTVHWFAEQQGTWDDMKQSLISVMNFNMFGIPMVGPVTCGFYGSHNSELCGRWSQLSQFFPLSMQVTVSEWQLIYNLDDPHESWARATLYSRLQYVRLLYTCLFEAQEFGETCFDPIIFHYSNNTNSLMADPTSFIFANALLVVPVLEPNVTEYSAFIPYEQKNFISLKNMKEGI